MMLVLVILCHEFGIVGVDVVLLYVILMQDNLQEVQCHDTDGQKDKRRHFGETENDLQHSDDADDSQGIRKLGLNMVQQIRA